MVCGKGLLVLIFAGGEPSLVRTIHTADGWAGDGGSADVLICSACAVASGKQ